VIFAKILRPTDGRYDETSVSAQADVVAVAGLDDTPGAPPEGMPLMEVKHLCASPDDDYKLGMGLVHGPFIPGPYRNRTRAVDVGDGRFNEAMVAKFGDLFTGDVVIFDVFGAPLPGQILKPAQREN
jgi:hypothetical protein